jgi:hypothetical protein
MAAALFDVVFQGRLVAGADPAQVRANLGKLFKLDAARIEALFATPSTVVKKGVDEATARNYQAALAKAGAAVSITAVPGVAAEPTAKPSAAPSETSVPMTIAEPGVLLVEPTTVTPANFDTAGLTLAEVGVTLVEPTTIAPPAFDLSGLTLDPPGTTLVDPIPVPPAKFDTSGLSLAER